MASDLALAKMYNRETGAGITHKDVQEWGFLETAIIQSSMELIADQQLMDNTPMLGEEDGDDPSSNQSSV